MNVPVEDGAIKDWKSDAEVSVVGVVEERSMCQVDQAAAKRQIGIVGLKKMEQ